MPKIKDEYDVGAAFEVIENELISSMIRNLSRHKQEEIKEDRQWSMWQVEELRSLEKYKKTNRKKYGKQFKDINAKIEGLIRTANEEGQMDQEAEILQAVRDGFPAHKASKGAAAEFFRLNDRKLDALVKATTQDMEKAETAVLRRADDQYRKIIYNAQVYANTGAGTYEKAVDMATKDFLAAGLSCIEYKNGARHTLADYADMAIRTASKRAYLQGEGVKRQEWGAHLVIMNKRGNPCPLCLPFVGKVLIDDVWSGGSGKDGDYPLMSSAIEAGLYHPRCRDSHTTYFPGISSPPEGKYTRAELEAIQKDAELEAKGQYAARQEKKYSRLAEYSLDPENREQYQRKAEQWKQTDDNGDAISDYTATKKKYDESVQRLNELEKQSDDLLDAYTIEIDGENAKQLEQEFNEKFDEVESFKQMVKDLKAQLSGKEAKAVRQVEKNLAVKTGIPIDKVSMTGMPYDSAKTVYDSYKTVLEQYPELKGQLAGFKYDGVSGDAYAGCYALAGKIEAHGLFSNYSKLVQTYADDVAAGFHPVGTDHTGVIVHELGHALDGYMTKKGLCGGVINQYGVVTRSATQIRNDVLSRLGYVIPSKSDLKKQGYSFRQINDIIIQDRKKFIKTHVSEYAADNEKEFFAECFSEYMTSKNPRKAAKIFGDIINKALGH